MVFAIEDIHWADEGMLDLIEYLARWVRGPAADRLPGARRAARPPPGLGRRPAQRDHDRARPAHAGRDARAGRRAARRRQRQRGNGRRDLVPQVAERSAGNPLFAEEMVNRILEEGVAGRQKLPETVHAVLAARLDSLAPQERRVLQHASVVGQTFWEGSLRRARARRARPRATRSLRSRRRT